MFDAARSAECEYFLAIYIGLSSRDPPPRPPPVSLGTMQVPAYRSAAPPPSHLTQNLADQIDLTKKQREDKQRRKDCSINYKHKIQDSQAKS